MDAEKHYRVWLTNVPGVTALQFYRLMALYGSAKDVWLRADESGIERAVGEKTANLVRGARDIRKAREIIEALDEAGVRAVIRGDDEYPARLEHVFDPPPLLYVKGVMANEERSVAVVGSRMATVYGKNVAYKLSRELAENGVTVVSGLALGIDAEAHKGALDAGGRTVAVLGCGLDVAYPSEHAQLMERIVENGGALISEHYLGERPLGWHFPVRNRIISGMSFGVLLVEGSMTSGARHTVECAQEQGREVFAVPGNITSKNSFLPNHLIQDGAKSVLTVADILDEFDWGVRAPAPTLLERRVPALDENEAKVAFLLENAELTFTEISETIGCEASFLNLVLTRMQLRGILKQLPGQVYVLSRQEG